MGVNMKGSSKFKKPILDENDENSSEGDLLFSQANENSS